MSEIQKPTIAVLIPCYNEEVTIGKVVQDFQKSLPEATIYVYDNNSSDRTAEIAGSLGAVVRHEPRQGKGNVIRAMFNEIDADAYVMVDGDDTYPAEDAPAMVEKVLEGYDMIIGDRLSSTYFQENKRPFHNFGNSLVRDSINILFQSDIKDIMTGYRAFSFAFVKSYPILSKGFEVETEMTIHSLDKNMKLYEMPIQYRDRPEGSVSKLNTVGDGIRVLSTIFRMIREYKPLPFFSALGGLFALIGIGLMIPIFIKFWQTGQVLQFPTLFGCFFIILAGLLLGITGIILDVIAKNGRKEFISTMNLLEYMKRK
ncbi:glycosyltransferase [Alloscardovia theropitheci]|uniref:Glycosyltransferase n=1 Tax=Alloscardovia theropitheci TaxID=2496842 RepID=A0A4V6N6W4_9BIFI|nr:glycosyltransferase family 2 protein [Alloscardovia theropitheci]TCD54159.1 glycosyltransferase [Alloscardovia theropitheci]